MAIFKTRVGLHNVPDHSQPVYKQLREAMEKRGFTRTATVFRGRGHYRSLPGHLGDVC